eukprot:3472346-Pleurochrysis_carterae.AAC.1
MNPTCYRSSLLQSPPLPFHQCGKQCLPRRSAMLHRKGRQAVPREHYAVLVKAGALACGWPQTRRRQWHR